MMIELMAEERAKKIIRIAVLISGEVAMKNIAFEIRAAQREAMEKCLTYIETAWFDKDGMLIAVDGKDFLDDVRSALIEEKE